jgi:hypothetical protein
MPEETRRILTQIGIYLGIMIFSYVFALIEVNTRAKKKVNEAEARLKVAQNAQSEAEAQCQAAQEALQAKLAELNLLRLWMDPAKNLLLELDGAEVDPQSLSADQRRRLIALLTHMRPWLDGGSAPASAPAPAPQAAPRPVASPAVPPSAPAEEEPAPGPLTIARQIDYILQKLVANTPLAAHGIRIRDLLSGGVEFVVDGKTYAGVDEIPDAQVQAAIRAAIAEWERKTG